MTSILQDVRYAVRSLRRRPLLAAAAIASLALGIGVNTAIFSVFDRMVLRKLSVPAPDDIVLLSAPGRKPGGTSSGDSGRGDQVFSYPLFRDLEQLSDTGLTRIVAHRDGEVSLGYRGRSSTGSSLLVSGSYFEVLGLSAAAGRLLTREDDRVLNGHPVVVLAHDYWTARFGADPRIVGESLVLNGRPFTVVGIGPPGFTGTTLMDRPDVFVPLAMAGQLGVGGLTRRDHWAYLFARLKPGVTRAQAEQAINGPFTALIRGVEYEELRSGLTDAERPQFLERRMVLVDGSRSRQQAPDEVRRLLSMMMVVTGLVLLIACANVANLLMARATDRGAEIAIRLSIGASAGRLVRLLLVEAILLGVAGSAGALAVAAGTHTALLGMLPQADVAALRFDLNRTVLLFAVLLGLGTSVIFGLYPALHGVWARSTGSPGQAARGSATRAATRFRTTLATAQIGLATALLATAALFAGSLTSLSRTDVGIDRNGVIAFRVAPHLNGYDQAQVRSVYDRLIAELRNLPSVTSASATSIAVLADEGWNQNITVQGASGSADAVGPASTARIDTKYFETLRVPVVAGREFATTDTTGSPRVAIVNRAFLRRFGLGADAVGRRLGLGAGERRVSDIEIIGVVEDAKYSSVRDDTPPQLFLPYRQAPVGPLTFYVRTASDVASLRAVVPSTVARIDPNVPVDDLQTLDDQIWENVTTERVLAALSSSFALLAAVLAGIGLYAVLAFTVAQRLKEFGIRMALGAGPRDVRGMMARHVARMAAIGTVGGVIAAFGLARLAQSLLYGVAGEVPVLIGSATLAMVAIMVVAAALPVRRAMRVEPVAALRLD